MSEFRVYTGSDEQIAELRAATNGVLIRLADDKPGENEFVLQKDEDFNRGISEYWIIPDDPFREMKVRWAMTGQPVWVKEGIDCIRPFIYETEKPDWHIPNAEYSFTKFDD